MVETFRIIKDENGKDAIEIIDTMQSRKVIDKQSIVEEIKRLKQLLEKFSKPKDL